MAKIIVKFNAAVINQLELTKDVTTFGRKPGNDIVIDHPAVSGFHGKIVKEGDQYHVEDLNSTNGTFVNGRKIKKSKIEGNDHIRVAKHMFEFTTEDAPPPPPAEPPETKGPSKISVDPSKIPSDEEQKEAVRKKMGLAHPSPEAPPETVGVIKILAGAVDQQVEFPLKDLVTYIGTSDQAAIKIKGFMAPGLAAAVSHRQEGYFLKAVKTGYPKVNGINVQEQVLLESGALIECGGTNMAFYLTEKK